MAGLRSFGRALSWLSFLPLASRAPDYGRLLWALARDERIPTSSKALLAGAAAYTVLPVDLVPDIVPIVGRLDDAVVIVLAIDLFLESVPRAILNEKLAELQIDGESLESDLARMRRLVPRPMRHAVRQLPRAVRGVEEFVQRSGVIPAARRWIEEANERADQTRMRARAARARRVGEPMTSSDPMEPTRPMEPTGAAQPNGMPEVGL
jgi:uncharacterized membrane protein YkvA (DUF1232 family)